VAARRPRSRWADPDAVTRIERALAGAGFPAAEDEAGELVEAAADARELEAMLQRRILGEPLAWILGNTRFCGVEVAVEPGVFVPRWQSEQLALDAVRRTPTRGIAVDVATGCGAVGLVLQAACSTAQVVGTELDPLAARCARDNGLQVLEGSLLDPLPDSFEHCVDIIVGILPYVPTEAIRYLPRDVQSYEPLLALDGGGDGLDLVRTVVSDSTRFLRPGGWLLLEVGTDQVTSVRALLRNHGYGAIEVIRDEEGDIRGLAAELGGQHRRKPHP
jgi:release factor glutamine methyltransferase